MTGTHRGAWFLLNVLLVVILVPMEGARAQDDVEQKELNALTALYNATHGANWTNNAGWLVGDDPGQWFGVSMKNDRVNFINLADNSLDGTLPPEIGDLERLEWFNFSNNKLRGSIPPEIGSLSLLESIFMENNQLSGSMPAELGTLTNLKFLYLHDNQLSGPLPPEIGQLTSLRELKLSMNQLEGPLPEGLGNLGSLERLELRHNRLTGSLPPSVGRLGRLRVLDLQENQFSGALPADVGGLTSLEYLNLFANDVSGAVPGTICNLQQLRHLNLGNNRIEDLPDLRCLSQDELIEFVDVSFNRLTFEDLEPSAFAVAEFIYEPQANIGEARTDTVAAGEDYTLAYTVGGTANLYQWHFKGIPLTSAATDAYTIRQAEEAHAGSYQLVITNWMVPGLTLRTEPVDVFVTTDPTYQPPDHPVITQPLDGAAVAIEGDVNDLFVVEWTQANDPDGDVVTYRWRLAFTPDFAVPLMDVETDTVPRVEIDYGTFHTLLSDHGVQEGNTVPLYHQVLASDGQTNASWVSRMNYALTITLGAVGVATEDAGHLPRGFRLRGNYPNPFHPSTQILLDVPVPAAVSVSVIDVTGRTVMQLPARRVPAGYARSVGIEAGDLASGVYLYRVTARTHDASHVQTGVFVLVR